MADPTLLYCVGATKAGTSWLYRTLHDHPECAVRAVKELHYWDTFEQEAREKQLAAFENQMRNYARQKAEAEAAERGWQVRNMERRLADLGALIKVVGGDRTGDLAYATYLVDGMGEGRLVADMTPNYAVLDDTRLTQMVELSPSAKVVYLIRDPLARMWSHIRMQAQRFRQEHEVFEEKANNILWRILNRGQETHILERGDYAGTITRLRRVVPEGRLLVAFCETLFTPAGLEAMCRFLGISYAPADGEMRVHEGPKAVMRDDLRNPAIALLKDQYDWVAREVGPLPAPWRDNLARIAA